MMEKINWYKEVLEIEPNSKVFFPLAKLLVKDNLDAEAISTLEKGLERHPEFLEARLLLIELLHKSGNAEACNIQIGKLNQIFTSYAGFWQAWAACLSSKPADADTATIVRLLAATFITGPINFHEVLDKGVAAILNEKKYGEEKESAVSESSTSPQTVIIQPEMQFITEENSASSGEASEQPTESEENLPAVEEQESALPGDDVSDDEELEPDERQSEENQGNITQSPVSLEPTDDYTDDALKSGKMPNEISLDLEPQEAETASMADTENTEYGATESVPQNMEYEQIPPVNEVIAHMENEDPEEFFSLRTRSMADVLASQGDIAGAIDIYSELAASTNDPQEKEELNKKIDELKGEEKNGQGTAGADESIEAIPPDKDSLIGILEALARRVQARVDS